MQNVTGDTDTLVEAHPVCKPVIRTLILDDSTFDRRRLRRLVDNTMLLMDVVEATSIATLPAALDSGRFDVILIDYLLAPGTGLDALAMVRNHAVNNRSATIMIAGDDRSEVAVRALRQGCSDYIAKRLLTAPDLRQRVLRAIETETGAMPGFPLAGPGRTGHGDAALRDYADALQPKLAHVIRDMRALRAHAAATQSDISTELYRIERQCLGIWGILLDPEAVGSGLRH